MNYEELAAFVNSVNRIPKRELKCHPSVTEALRNLTRTGEYTLYDELLTQLTGIPVYEDPEMYYGAWELCEDGVVTASWPAGSGTLKGSGSSETA